MEVVSACSRRHGYHLTCFLMSSLIKTIKPVAVANRTEAQLNDQGITYNEAGATYNEVGIAYGGIYGNTDFKVIVAKATDIKP